MFPCHHHNIHLDERFSAMEAMLVMMLETALNPPPLSLSASATLNLSCSSPSPCGSKVDYFSTFGARLELLVLLILDLVWATQLLKPTLTMFKLPLKREQDRCYLIWSGV